VRGVAAARRPGGKSTRRAAANARKFFAAKPPAPGGWPEFARHLAGFRPAPRGVDAWIRAVAFGIGLEEPARGGVPMTHKKSCGNGRRGKAPVARRVVDDGEAECPLCNLELSLEHGFRLPATVRLEVAATLLDSLDDSGEDHRDAPWFAEVQRRLAALEPPGDERDSVEQLLERILAASDDEPRTH
jgi:hypothetical protein